MWRPFLFTLIMKKNKAPVLRIRKDGKPYEGDKKRYREYIKSNFAEIRSFEGETLPPAMRGFYNQINSAKERATTRFHNPETGRFFNKKENKAIESALKNFSRDTGKNFDDLKNKKDIIRTIYEAEINNQYIRQIPSDKIGDMVKDTGIRKVIIFDQNGKEKQVTPEQAILAISRANKKALEAIGGKGFNPVNKTILTELKGTLKVFVPNFRGMSDEEITELLSDLMDNQDYELSKS